MLRVTWLLFLLVAPTAYAGSTAIYVRFETDCLHLANGVVSPCNEVLGAEGWDLRVAYNALRPVHAILVQNPRSRIQVAYVGGASFADVTRADAESAEFSPALATRSFDLGSIVLFRTQDGVVYKVGHLATDEVGVQLQYEALMTPSASVTEETR